MLGSLNEGIPARKMPLGSRPSMYVRRQDCIDNVTAQGKVITCQLGPGGVRVVDGG